MSLAKIGWTVAAVIAFSTWAAAEQANAVTEQVKQVKQVNVLAEYVNAVIKAGQVNAVIKQVKIDVFNWCIATPDQSKAMRDLFDKNPEKFNKIGQVAKITGNIIIWYTLDDTDINGDWKPDIVTINWVNIWK